MENPRARSTASRKLVRGGRARREVRLVVVFPRELARIIPLDGSAQLGRQPEDARCELAHLTVSRRHLALDWDPLISAHVARDLGSHNGSWIDGIPLGEAGRVLPDGARLRLGDVLLVHESRGQPAADDRTEVSRDAIPGEAWVTQELRARVARAGPDPSPVLLTGETGTGKEHIAAEVHRLSRRRGPLVVVNCAALSPQLVESQLFGHVRGAFTGAETSQPGMMREAERGTLFLDEIGELALDLQAKLLRAIQEHEVQQVGATRSLKVDVRIVAATNCDLAEAIAAGRFRRDLYARLALLEIHVPTLARRRADVLGWVDRLHRRWHADRGRSAELPALDVDIADALLARPWPGNLRDLDRLVHELAGGGTVSTLLAGAPTPSPPAARLPVPTGEELARVFAALGGSVRAVAKHFGRDRRQIYRWMEAHGVRKTR